ncbi:Nuclear cap-binding protein subunit 1-B [Varanus komodoensis]|nr:Nuclear cap-binding protein subunit 1-B [Varanus komodoensis]
MSRRRHSDENDDSKWAKGIFKLKLNPDKKEVLLVGGSGFGEGGYDLVLNGVALPLRDKVRSLGVLLDPELSLEAQVTAAARSAFLQLRLINQPRPYLEYDCLAMVTHALVTSRLDFSELFLLCLIETGGQPHKRRRTSHSLKIEDRLESLICRVGEKNTSSLESNLEGLAGVLEADLPNYKSKILRLLCTVYVCKRSMDPGDNK